MSKMQIPVIRLLSLTAAIIFKYFTKKTSISIFTLKHKINY